MHSTGKYSTKQTAKKRYLPRVRKGVKQFVDLEKALDKPEAIQAYNQFVEDNLGSALSLFGASTRIGELPDKGSRTVEAEVEDFIKLCKALGKVGVCVSVGMCWRFWGLESRPTEPASNAVWTKSDCAFASPPFCILR